jgi:cell division protein FtsN
VLLTFGLTVTGVVYLAKYLIGAPPANRAAVPKEDEEVVILYGVEPDNNSAVIITNSDISQNGGGQNSTYSGGGFRPITISPVVPSAVPPSAVTPAEAAPAASAATTPIPSAPSSVSAAPAPVKANAGKYQLQLFAFSSKDTADREAAKLKAEYPDIYVVQAEVRGGTWYRVRCCRTDSKSEAERVRSEITAKHREIHPDVISN